MVIKKKLCAGFDGVEHEAIIYKNISSKKYCKSCAFKLQPSKQIKKMSKKQVFKMSLKKELLVEDKKFYIDVWIGRFFIPNPDVPGTFKKLIPCKCENPDCKQYLGDEPNMMFFHHILEKRNFPELRHEKKNIAIICAECHNKYETMPDKVPYLVQRREKLLKEYEHGRL